MRICHIGKFGNVSSNQDEESVTHALTLLGHDVVDVHERDARRAIVERADLCLFHHWYDPQILRRLPMPTVFWYFDLVYYPDPTLAARNHRRQEWMRATLPYIQIGFCTDGDWVEQDTTGKLVLLRQGADERVAGPGIAGPDVIPILFTGISRGGGVGRISFIEEMRHVYGDRFRHVSGGVHGRDLANLIASAQIVVAPDSPVTDRYWSNRIYLTLGFEGFLMHPWCVEANSHYLHKEEVVYYANRAELHAMIDFYLRHPGIRKEIAEAGLQRTLAQHTYRHRCEELIRVVRERLD